MATFIQVISTLPSQPQALELARRLVEARLAACVQVSAPVTSVYHWQGAVETSQEWLVVAKSRQDIWEQLEQFIRENHPYDLPEIVVTPIVTGSREYLDWIDAEVVTPSEP